MTIAASPDLARTMSAPARVIYRAPGITSIVLSLAPEDMDALDPQRTGAVELFGVMFYAEVSA